MTRDTYLTVLVLY